MGADWPDGGRGELARTPLGRLLFFASCKHFLYYSLCYLALLVTPYCVFSYFDLSHCMQPEGL